MSSLDQLNIHLSMDTVQFVQALNKAEKFTRRFQQDFEKSKEKARQFSSRTVEYLGNIERAAKNINTAAKWEFRFGNVERLRSLATQFTQISDRHTELSNKLKLVTESEVQHARAMADVYDISLKTAQSTQATSSVYQTFSQNAEHLKIAQSDVAKLTEIVAKSVAISGASSATASNALVQFSQSLLMGKMKAQEFNSLMTQTPSVVQAIAKGLGITTAELKAMVDNGELTAEKMIEGLKKAESYVNGQYAKTTTTISGAMQNLSTAAEKWVGEMDSAVGVSEKVVAVLDKWNANFDTVATTLLVAGGALALFKGYMSVRPFVEVRAAIYDNKKAIIAENQARQQTIATRQQELVVLSQQTSLTLEQTLKTYNQNKAELESIAVKQQKITKEREEIAVAIQAAATRTERLALSAELQALDQKEIALGQQKIAIERQQIATKQALKVAYAENAVAQSAMVASTVTATTTTTAMKGVIAGVRNELNLWKAAALANPLMTFITIGGAAFASIMGIVEAQRQAREEALRYADTLDTVRANIERMTLAQTEAEMVKLSRSIREQENALADLKNRQAELNRKIEEGATVYEDAFAGTVRIAMSAEELAKTQEELKLVNADVESSQKKLNASYETQNDLQAHIPVAELRSAFEQLFPNIDISAASTDSLTASVNGFTLTIPSAVVEAYKLAGAIGVIQKTAIDAALAVANLAGIAPNGEVLSDKAQKYISRLNKQTKISQLKREGKTDEANKLQAELNLEGQEFTGIDYEKAYEAQLANLKESSIKTGGGGKPKKTQAEKEAEKAAKKQQRDAERSAESYQNQVAEMTNRLSGLKTDREDLSKHGGISQYQEVRKLTEDIALNAEKYKNYGTEGVAKLKELAAKIDSEQQLMAIEQFQIDHDKKLKAMQFELDLVGKSRTEQELLQFSNQLNLDAERMKIEMTKENIALLDEKIAKIKQEYELHQKKQEEIRASASAGFKAGIQEFANDVTNINENVKGITVNAFGSMSSALNDFVMTGKADFSSMAQSILGDINKMIIKMMIFKAIEAGGKAMGFDMSFMGQLQFANGGYTGDGGKYTPAGIVHKGEYVITKEATARLGLDYLNYLNYGKRGFSSGGGVAVPRVPSISANVGGAMAQQNDVSITINIDHSGNEQSSVQAQAEQGKQLGNLIKAQVLKVLASEKRVGGMLAM